MTRPQTALSDTLVERSGRPPNRFTMKPDAFKFWKANLEWEEGWEKFFKPKAFGAIGLSPDDKLKVEVRRAELGSACFYVNVCSFDGKLNFTLPGPVHQDDLKKLSGLWQFFEFNWAECEPSIAGTLPREFRFSSAVTGANASKRVWVGYTEADKVVVTCTAGWPSIARATGRELLGVLGDGPGILKEVYTHKLTPKVKWGDGTDMVDTFEARELVRCVSSHWAKEKFIHPQGLVPHLGKGSYQL